MKKPLLVISVLSIMVLAAVPMRAGAQDRNEEALQSRVKLEFNDARRSLIENRCQAVKNRLNAIQNTTLSLNGRRHNLINGMLDKLNTFAERAEAAGYDTTELKSDLQELSRLAAESSTEWSAFRTGLDETLQIDCVADARAFHDALEAVKAAHDGLKSQMKTVKDFFISDIKADLADIRQQISDLNPSGEGA